MCLWPHKHVWNYCFPRIHNISCVWTCKKLHCFGPQQFQSYSLTHNVFLPAQMQLLLISCCSTVVDVEDLWRYCCAYFVKWGASMQFRVAGATIWWSYITLKLVLCKMIHLKEGKKKCPLYYELLIYWVLKFLFSELGGRGLGMFPGCSAEWQLCSCAKWKRLALLTSSWVWELLTAQWLLGDVWLSNRLCAWCTSQHSINRGPDGTLQVSGIDSLSLRLQCGLNMTFIGFNIR